MQGQQGPSAHHRAAASVQGCRISYWYTRGLRHRGARWFPLAARRGTFSVTSVGRLVARRRLVWVFQMLSM